MPGGAVGEVRLVWHEPLQRMLVQKTIDLLGLEDAVAYREPRLLDRVEHDHVVKIRDAQPDRDIQHGLTLVMDYLAGGSVHSALQGGHRFGVRRALILVGHILDALDHLHAKHGFLHRDVKPGNVLLDESRETAYLGDLGSAAPLSVEVPGGLGTPERIDWIARRVDPLLAGQPAILRQRDRTTDPPS
nr:protein kinase [Salinispora pacifica]